MQQVKAVQKKMQDEEVLNIKVNRFNELNEQIELLDTAINKIDERNGKFSEKLPLLIKKLFASLKYNYYRFKPQLKKYVFDYLSDDTMILLAIGMVPAIVLPYFFDFRPIILTIFEVINYIVLLLFLAEFILKLYVADSWKDFFSDKWRFLDLFILCLAGIEFIPTVKFAGTTASPLLRLFRLARVAAVTGRTAGRKRKKDNIKMDGDTKVCIFDSSLSTACKLINENDFDEHVKDNNQWIDIQNINSKYIKKISSIVDIPKEDLKNIVNNEVSPGIDYTDKYIMIIIKDLKLEKFDDEPVLEKFDDEPVPIKTSHKNLAIIFTESSIITLSLTNNNMFDRITRRLCDTGKTDLSNFTLQILYSILETKIDDYRKIINKVDREIELIELESGQKPDKSREVYLKDTFLLKKEINNAHYGLKRMEHILGEITKKNGKELFKEMSDAESIKFITIRDEASNIKADADNIRENLSTLIDMQMNRTSYITNKVVKILTIITCLAAIPSIITGFFGINILTSPFDISQFEVFTLVVYLTVWGGLYVYIKGWLN